MKIEITDKTIMTAALKKTEEEDFFEALCLQIFQINVFLFLDFLIL